MPESGRKTIGLFRQIFRIYWNPLFAAAGIVWVALGAIDLISEEFGSAHLQKVLRAGGHIPHLSLAAWIAIALGIVMIAGLRGTWQELKRVDESRRAELETERTALAEERATHQKTRADLERQLAQPVSTVHRDR